MRKARRLGNYIQHLSNVKQISNSKLADLLGISLTDVDCLFKGLTLPTFPQMQILSCVFSVSSSDLLRGDDKVYAQTVVSCIGDFDNEDNREEILDIIESYILLCQ